MSRFIVALLIILSAPVMAQKDPSQLFDKLLYTSGKDTLPYRLLKPENSETKKFPLVIFLHGAGERGIDNEVHIKHITAVFGHPDNRRKYPCYVLAAQCPQDMMWAGHDREGNRLVMRANPTKPMALLIQLIEKIENEFPIDPTRIYVTGLSMGGFGAFDLLARFPQRFAAAAPICGGGDPETVSSFKHVPIWAFHGALDRVVSARQSRVMVTALHEAGAAPGYTEYPDVGHDSWTFAYADPYLLPWLFSKQLGKKSFTK
jgi:predicted peptidase